ncbi:heat-inducible transcriptional repressor HrcA [Curtobacterium herbarum]|uniref:Heat-inducible transcription repressor HrcA n=1 Tax=Curtobacterium herbarum TaxID=150122 RepID=A0ABN1ZCS6_9MICO|nr:heat-inducible transcriptional repressor HrcA [Curtobacterium herbarum]MBM7475738.1 heat-inducible transcriptional repressor [Curtobacterium herbarum]MCS6543650.1 heat-inducible transcriptional repressor HrcA [Curtobacterium herbarum]
MVSERSLEVLKAIVRDYVASREPVGSKTIVDRHAFGVSAATIRNDMAQLEDEQLIIAPHTSSGRVPTDKGYRVFVDHLAAARPLSGAQRQAIETFLGASNDLDDVLTRTVRLLSQLTNQVALVQYPTMGHARVQHVELVRLADTRLMVVLITDTARVEQRVIETDVPFDESALAELRTLVNGATVGLPLQDAPPALRAIPGQLRPAVQPLAGVVVASLVEQVAANRQDRLLMAGAANLAKSEQDFSGGLFPVLEAIEEQVTLLRLFGEMQVDDIAVAASIGRENAEYGLDATSIVAGGYLAARGEIARLGVLGPTRMDYGTNMAAVRAVARYLSRLLGEN